MCYFKTSLVSSAFVVVELVPLMVVMLMLVPLVVVLVPLVVVLVPLVVVVFEYLGTAFWLSFVFSYFVIAKVEA